jgi:hypothetical protein
MVLTTATQTLTNKTFSGAQGFGTASLDEPTGTAPLYMCRAWVNFNGSLSGSIAPRASGNVSSVTKNGTGDYTVNFTTAMPDANYSVATVGSQSWSGDNISAMGIYQQGGDYNYSTTSIRVRNRYFTGVGDVFNANVQVFR